MVKRVKKSSGGDWLRFRHLGPALQWLREAHNVSQSDLARVAEMDPAQLCRYELGYRVPDLKTLDRLLRALGADVMQLAYALLRADSATEPSPDLPEPLRDLAEQEGVANAWQIFRRFLRAHRLDYQRHLRASKQPSGGEGEDSGTDGETPEGTPC